MSTDANFNCPRCGSAVVIEGINFRCSRDTCSWGLNPAQRPAKEAYMVFCWAAMEGEDAPGEYVLATRQVFPKRKSAEAYARTIHKSRCPMIFPREEIVRAATEGYRSDATWDLDD